jgi:signal transduction histidine kinase
MDGLGTDRRGPVNLVALLKVVWRRLHTNTGAGRDAFPLAARRVINAAKAQAATAEGRLTAAIEAMPEGVVFLDEEGRYILWNERYAEIYHRSADLFEPGRKLADTLRIGVERGDYPDAIGREEEWLEARLALLDNPAARHEQRLADGRWIMIEERKTADGGTIGIRVDITEMKKAEETLTHALAQAEAANRAKSEFLANMSHEIRTPLNGVMGMAHVLNGTGLEPVQRKLVGTILESAEALEHLLTDLLDLTRIEAGRLEMREEDFDLGDMIHAVAAQYEVLAGEKRLKFEAWIDPHLSRHVVGDSKRLRQVIGNLLSNAVKFTAEGGVSLRVFPGEADGICVFQVRDTGIGFEAAQAEALFGRFVQADGSMTRKYGGSGLGLAICRELVEMMGGQVTASGAPGQGAVFRVELPLLKADAIMLAGVA